MAVGHEAQLTFIHAVTVNVTVNVTVIVTEHNSRQHCSH